MLVPECVCVYVFVFFVVAFCAKGGLWCGEVCALSGTMNYFVDINAMMLLFLR